MTTNDSVVELADRALLDRARRLALDERRATVSLLRALMEIDSRRLYLGEGCSSMFTYCTQVLRLSEGGAYNRIEALRAARRYPVIFDLLESAAVTLTSVRLLAPHLTEENHRPVLDSARHKSKREVEELLAALRPKADAPTVLRRLASPGQPTSSAVSRAEALPTSASRMSFGIAVSKGPGVALPPPRLGPIAPDRYRLQVTLTGATHEKFRRAQALLRHAVPTGDAAEILDRALSLLVDHLEHQRSPGPRSLGLHAPPRRGHATSRPPCGAKSGDATADVAHSLAPRADAGKPCFSSSIT